MPSAHTRLLISLEPSVGLIQLSIYVLFSFFFFSVSSLLLYHRKSVQGNPPGDKSDILVAIFDIGKNNFIYRQSLIFLPINTELV